jgi:hypothetical protein
MPRTLTAAAVAAALTASVAPGLASAASSAAAGVAAKSRLVERIAAKSSYVGVRYQLDAGGLSVLRANSENLGGYGYFINKIPVNHAQLPLKLEWVLGVYTQARGDDYLRRGIRDRESFHRPAAGTRLIDEGLADYRLSNYYIGRADTALGVRHPAPSARRLQPAGLAGATTAPAAGIPDKSALVTMITMGTKVIQERIPERLPKAQYALLRPNKVACHYYEVVVGRLHVDGAQRPAQQEWVKGVRTQQLGDQQLSIGVNDNVGHEGTTAKAVLGIHRSRPSARLPKNVLYYP